MPVNGGPETRVLDLVWRFNYVATDNGVYYTPRTGKVSVAVRSYFDFATRRHSEIAALDVPSISAWPSPPTASTCCLRRSIT